MMFKSRRIKLAIVACAMIAIVVSVFASSSRTRVDVAAVAPETSSLSPEELVDNFDKTIQRRFLTIPTFGHARLVFVPVRPTGPKPGHLDNFTPNNEAESAAVGAFAKKGWDIGMYLFGRKVVPREKTKKENDYDIRYRLFNPIPVTAGMKRKNFPNQKKLANDAKLAFLEFQSGGKKEMRFDRGEWSYIARPVRVANQSCLQCHTDYVITDKLAEGKFTARPRKVGDVNGVLFYALRKHVAKD